MKYLVVWDIALPGGGREDTSLDFEAQNDDAAVFAVASTFAFWVETQFPGSFGFLYQGERVVARLPTERRENDEKNRSAPRVKTLGAFQ